MVFVSPSLEVLINALDLLLLARVHTCSGSVDKKFGRVYSSLQPNFMRILISISSVNLVLVVFVSPSLEVLKNALVLLLLARVYTGVCAYQSCSTYLDHGLILAASIFRHGRRLLYLFDYVSIFIWCSLCLHWATGYFPDRSILILVASIIRHGLVSLLYLFDDVDNFIVVVFRCPSFLVGGLYLPFSCRLCFFFGGRYARTSISLAQFLEPRNF